MSKAYSDTYPIEVREPKEVHVPIEQIEIPKEVEEEPKVEVPQPVTVVPITDCYIAMKKVWPQNLWSDATTVISRESGGRSDAISSTDDHGCFQINKGLTNYGSKIYDATFNVTLAYNHFYLNRGWKPWYCCKELW